MRPEGLILVGGGAFARELINWVADAVDIGNSLPIVGFLDQSADALNQFGYPIPYRGTIETYQPVAGEYLVMAISDPSAKQMLYIELKGRGAEFASVVHPSAVVARTATLGEGVIVCPHGLVSAEAKIGQLVAINALSSVGHDVDVGAFSTLSAHVDLTGRVRVGEKCFFGTGAKVLPGVNIGEGSTIGAGSVVMRRVQPGSVMYAQPAKKL